jgi:pimeloyl-[acyl-carrier protein] methyl ester esterase
MPEEPRPPLQVIAMHGWAADSRCWQPWIERTETLEWRWECGERGYGELTPLAPVWPENLPANTLRVVIGHSLGPHFITPEVLQQANAVVLLASFGTFVPPDRPGRRVRMALDGMAAKLDSQPEAKDMLRKFLTNAAAPQPVDSLPAGPENSTLDLRRLREDLTVLRACEGSPRGFPGDARVLIVEAEDDRIVEPEARRLLRDSLPGADLIAFPGVGHALLAGDVIGRVVEWIEAWRAGEK